jgi:hypothetical protein
LSQKQNENKRAGGIAQVVEHLPSMHSPGFSLWYRGEKKPKPKPKKQTKPENNSYFVGCAEIPYLLWRQVNVKNPCDNLLSSSCIFFQFSASCELGYVINNPARASFTFWIFGEFCSNSVRKA